MSETGGAYVLGHSQRELDRLAAQAQMIDPVTERFFREAGVMSGMRVLDVGSGVGDVSFLVADLVGDTGEVIGVDRSADALAMASARAAERSGGNVSFREGDPAEMEFERRFDAVVGRYVLQFQSDPGAMLRRLASHLRPGGLVVFHEIDWSGVRSMPPVPTYDTCCAWLVETLRLSSTERHMGAALHAAFTAAGLPAPTMRLEALLGGGKAASPLQLIAGLAASLWPTAVRLGASVPSDLDLDSLLDRMRDEAQATNSLVVGHFQVAAWATVS